MDKFYITTPIYYVNANPHIGHTYTTVAADVLARYHRMIGDKTFFATGTDEHGTKVAQKALEAKKEPQEFVDEVAAQFMMAWDELNISNNRFIRTTESNHGKAVQQALQYMYDKGDIYKDVYEGFYCTGCEQFKNEKDLIDDKCPDHLVAPEKMSEETYVFRMSKYADVLMNKIESDELKIRPLNKKNEILSFYKNEGLKDVSFSRPNVKWGIPLPWDSGHTAYVWSDAFLNYLTILDWDGSGGQAPKLFPPEVQLMSKDILRVHATIWPAMLLSLDLPLMKQIFVHGFFLINGQKMSKSMGNVISPGDLKDKYGVDGTRYLLMSVTTFGRDGDVQRDKFEEKFNADLANGIGNLVARSITLTTKLPKEKIRLHQTKGEAENIGGTDFDHSITHTWDRYHRHMADLEIDRALELVMQEARFLDIYISTTKPWEMIKQKHSKAGVVLYNSLERIRHMAIMLWPFMPETAEKIWQRLGLEEQMSQDFIKITEWGRLPIDTKIEKGEPLFPRI